MSIVTEPVSTLVELSRERGRETQMVRIVYFAWLRERIGKAEEAVELPAGVATIADLVQWLRSRGPEYANAFARPEVVRAAIDQSHVKPSASLAGAREIAFFPPVTGG